MSHFNETGAHQKSVSRGGWILSLLATLAILAALFAPMATPSPSVAAEESTALVFLVDGSGSIDATDWQIQKDGLTAALQDVVSFPRDGSIAVGVVQWSASFTDEEDLTRVEVQLTVLTDDTEVDSVIDDIQAMDQLQEFTNPGDGIRAGTDMLLSDAAPTANAEWILCMSTDGITTSGEDLDSATTYAQTNGVDKYSVIGIEDPPFFDAADLRAHYSPHVFGGGGVTIARDSIEFANLIVGACLGDLVELRALEVNQAVQDWHNSVPLITDKPTTVRAFVQVPDGEDDQQVIGRLYGRRGGADLPGSPLLALNPGSAITAQEDIVSRRGDFDASLNFRLPLSWRHGTVKLEFEAAGAPINCQEPSGPGSDPAGDCIVTITFQDEVTPEVVFVGVSYESGGVTVAPTTSELFEQMFRFRSIFPIASIDYRMDTLGAYSSTPSLSTVNSALETKRFLDAFFCIFGCSDPTSFNSRYYGVLDGSGGGLANDIPGTVSSGFLSGTGGRNDTGYARNRGPHELAHNLGIHHAVDKTLPLSGGLNQGRCGSVASTSSPGHTPFETVDGNVRPVLGTLSDGPNNEVWGLDNRFLFWDPSDLAVIDPRETFEMMSYCSGGPQARWISKFTYELVMGEFPASGVSISGFHTSADHVLVNGTIDFEANTATIERALEMTGNPPVPTSGNYRLELLDSDGNLLEGADFDPIVMDADAEFPETPTGPEIGLILVPLPAPEEPIFTIQVLHEGNVIGSLAASDNPPTVSIVTPSGGETFADPTVTFEWTGSDPDGDPLVYTVLYSADDGDTWDTLTVDTDETSLEVPRSSLEASTQARLRVIVSDGVHSASAVSEQFTVANNEPVVTIANPANGAVFSGHQNVDLVGTAFDTEDGALDGAALSWTSDVDGHLGNGAEVSIAASSLTEGQHVVTLTATDSDGASASAWVRIAIFRVAPSPAKFPTADAGADQTVECGVHGGAIVTLDGTGSSEPDGEPLEYFWSADEITFNDPTSATPTATFPLGTTTVTLVVFGPTGLSDTDTVVITVQDTTPPDIVASVDPNELWPANHEYVEIDLSVEVVDACDPSPHFTVTVVSNQPDNAQGQGDGNTTGDIRVTTAGGDVVLSSNDDPVVSIDPAVDQLELRAERAAGSSGRVYSVKIAAEDASGNMSESTVEVTVPRDRSSGQSP